MPLVDPLAMIIVLCKDVTPWLCCLPVNIIIVLFGTGYWVQFTDVATSLYCTTHECYVVILYIVALASLCTCTEAHMRHFEHSPMCPPELVLVWGVTQGIPRISRAT